MILIPCVDDTQFTVVWPFLTSKHTLQLFAVFTAAASTTPWLLLHINNINVSTMCSCVCVCSCATARAFECFMDAWILLLLFVFFIFYSFFAAFLWLLYVPEIWTRSTSERSRVRASSFICSAGRAFSIKQRNKQRTNKNLMMTRRSFEYVIVLLVRHHWSCGILLNRRHCHRRRCGQYHFCFVDIHCVCLA